MIADVLKAENQRARRYYCAYTIKKEEEKEKD
jgi:hypothetical protein